MASLVVPDSDGITTIEPSRRPTWPVAMISAALTRWAGNGVERCSSWAAGSISTPAPPAPRKKRLGAPRSTRSAIGSRSGPARSTAPPWMVRKRSSSKLSMTVSLSMRSPGWRVWGRVVSAFEAGDEPGDAERQRARAAAAVLGAALADDGAAHERGAGRSDGLGRVAARRGLVDERARAPLVLHAERERGEDAPAEHGGADAGPAPADAVEEVVAAAEAAEQRQGAHRRVDGAAPGVGDPRAGERGLDAAQRVGRV